MHFAAYTPSIKDKGDRSNIHKVIIGNTTTPDVAAMTITSWCVVALYILELCCASNLLFSYLHNQGVELSYL